MTEQERLIEQDRRDAQRYHDIDFAGLFERAVEMAVRSWLDENLERIIVAIAGNRTNLSDVTSRITTGNRHPETKR